jgi:hypothetical protein
MSKIHQLLLDIKKRPTLYLSRYSIFDMQSFYHGYYAAKRELNLHQTTEVIEFEDFLEWIRSVYKIKTNQSWAMLILFHSIDEKDALDRFFQLFEEFMKTKSGNDNRE